MTIDLIDIGAIAVVVTPLIILLAALFADPSDLEIHAPSRVLDWPRGVQEEEPVHWRVEQLSRPPRSPSMSASRAVPLNRPIRLERGP